jgi:hypothetical protein
MRHFVTVYLNERFSSRSRQSHNTAPPRATEATARVDTEGAGRTVQPHAPPHAAGHWRAHAPHAAGHRRAHATSRRACPIAPRPAWSRGASSGGRRAPGSALLTAPGALLGYGGQSVAPQGACGGLSLCSPTCARVRVAPRRSPSLPSVVFGSSERSVTKELTFHVGNTGSNPVGVASLKTLAAVRDRPDFREGILSAMFAKRVHSGSTGVHKRRSLDPSGLILSPHTLTRLASLGARMRQLGWNAAPTAAGTR